MVYCCAPVVRLPLSGIGAPAMTDFSRIYICEEASAAEQLVLLRHEQAHIWLKHKERVCPDPKGDPKLWTIAKELEIARNIYDADDLEIIGRPMSYLKGGYLPDTFETMPPELVIAEDIYQWLVDNPEAQPKGGGACMTMTIIQEETEETEPTPGKDAPAPVTMTKEEIEEVVDHLRKRSTDEQARVYKKHRLEMPRPTLASHIDYILRSAHTREASYRRPSRKQDETPFIIKGSVRRKKSPLVEIFIDRSGSFHGERTRLSEQKIGAILRKYKARLQSDVFYFSNGKMYTHDVPANGGNPYPLVMKHLEQSRPKIAVIMTDDDLEGDLKPLSHKLTQIICVPIGVGHTCIASKIDAIDLKE